MSIRFPEDRINIEEGIGTVQFNNFRLCVLNALRRTIHSDVPSVAMRAEPHQFKTIHIKKNSSPLNHQFLSHRISLIPVNLPVPPSGFEGVLAKYEIRIYKENPVDSDIEHLLVTTDDIHIINIESGKELPDGERALMFPRDPYSNEGILIAILKKGQELEVQATLSVGIGAEHACFKPTSQCSYEFGIDPTIAERMRREQLKELLANKKGIDEVKQREIESQFNRTFELLDKQRAVQRDADGNPINVLFMIESIIRQRNPFFILVDATNVLLEKFTNLRIAIQSEDATKIEILYDNLDTTTTSESQITGERESKEGMEEIQASASSSSSSSSSQDFVIRFYKEGHTIGSLLQETLLKHPMILRDIDSWFIGYRLPHPLTQEMVLRVSQKSKSSSLSKDILKTILVETIHSLSVEFTNIRNGIIEYINRKGFPEHPLKHLIEVSKITATGTGIVFSGAGEPTETSNPSSQKEVWVPGEILGEARKLRRNTGMGAGVEYDDTDTGVDYDGEW
jgi:DNA-directed RNA polymerase subunit L/DNA-directed RNA polymerase alpha subunit